MKGNPANGGNMSLFSIIGGDGWCCWRFGGCLTCLLDWEFLLSPISIELSEFRLSGELIDGDEAAVGCLAYSSNLSIINSSFVHAGRENRLEEYDECRIRFIVLGESADALCIPFRVAASCACCCSCRRQWILNQFDRRP